MNVLQRLFDFSFHFPLPSPKKCYLNIAGSFLTVPQYKMNPLTIFCLPQSLPITPFPFVSVNVSLFSLSVVLLISPDPSHPVDGVL